MIAPPFAAGAARLPPPALDAASADRLEASFLAEMMKYIGPTGPRDAGPNGAGESEFQSFLARFRAEAMARRLDLGLTRATGT